MVLFENGKAQQMGDRVKELCGPGVSRAVVPARELTDEDRETLLSGQAGLRRGGHGSHKWRGDWCPVDSLGNQVTGAGCGVVVGPDMTVGRVVGLFRPESVDQHPVFRPGDGWYVVVDQVCWAPVSGNHVRSRKVPEGDLELIAPESCVLVGSVLPNDTFDRVSRPPVDGEIVLYGEPGGVRGEAPVLCRFTTDRDMNGDRHYQVKSLAGASSWGMGGLDGDGVHWRDMVVVNDWKWV